MAWRIGTLTAVHDNGIACSTQLPFDFMSHGTRDLVSHGTRSRKNFENRNKTASWIVARLPQAGKQPRPVEQAD
jgi:hypothetical protein